MVQRLLIHGLPTGTMESLSILPPDVAIRVGQLEQLLVGYDAEVRNVFGLSEESKVTRWAQSLSRTLALIEETSGDIYAWADNMTRKVSAASV